MKTCLDCLHCKVIFPVNQENPLLTDLTVTTSVNSSSQHVRNLRCAKDRWDTETGVQKKTIRYDAGAKKHAQNGKSRFLNLNRFCEDREYMEDHDES